MCIYYITFIAMIMYIRGLIFALFLGFQLLMNKAISFKQLITH